MIHLYGYETRNAKNPKGDIEIVITNPVIGDKIHEQLFLHDRKEKTEHPKVFKIKDEGIDTEYMREIIQSIKKAIIANDVSTINEISNKGLITQDE